MKRALIALLTMGTVTLIHAQGVVSMNTFGGGVNARATNIVTSLPAGLANPNQFKVGLYWGAVGAAEDTFALVGAPASFGNSAGQAGYVITATGGGNRVIPGRGAGSQIAAQIRAWTGTYDTYEAAVGAGDPLVFAGKSGVVTVTLTEPPTPPAVLTGLTPFLVTAVPEPTTIALGLLGIVGALFIRRRK